MKADLRAQPPAPPHADIRRILAIRMDNIGDLVMLSPALRALKQHWPQAEITLLTSPAGSTAAAMLPWVNDVITWRALWQDVSGEIGLDPDREIALADMLRERNFDIAFIFTSFSQSPFPPAYLCYLAGIPVRVGHSKEFGGSVLAPALTPPADGTHQADRNLALLNAYGIPAADRRLKLEVPRGIAGQAQKIAAATGVDLDQPYILAAPGASCSARRYPPERFAAALQILASSLDIPILIAGSQREAAKIRPVIELAESGLYQNVKSVVGLTTVPEFAALIRKSSLVIANNSAALHIADAFERPMVILYSGTELEEQWQPRNAPARLLRRSTFCSPCYRFSCPFSLECLDFTPVEVARVSYEMFAQEYPGSLGNPPYEEKIHA